MTKPLYIAFIGGPYHGTVFANTQPNWDRLVANAYGRHRVFKILHSDIGDILVRAHVDLPDDAAELAILSLDLSQFGKIKEMA